MEGEFRDDNKSIIIERRNERKKKKSRGAGTREATNMGVLT